MSKLINENVIVVIGCGRLGSSIAKTLTEEGEQVLCIDENAQSFDKLDDFEGFTEVGDATDLDFLSDLGLEKAKAIIITTENDDVNIYLGHVAFLMFNNLKIFIRLADSDKSQLLKDTPIKAIYPFILSLDNFKHMYKEDKQ